jgi:HAD superfamily hydrolase (TIGR01549 family)
MKYQAVFFDFDGVILDSVHVKTEAFAAMYRAYGPDMEKAVVRYHLDNGGVSRFEKFRYYQTKLLGEPATAEKLAELGEQFQSLVLEKVLKAPFIPGAFETLEQLRRRNIPAFVVSGTPDDEIQYIVSQRRLDKYFVEVHGSPTTKDALVLDIAERHQLRLADCLFCGDATTDYEAARKTGTAFLGIVQEGGNSPFPAGTPIKKSVSISC